MKFPFLSNLSTEAKSSWPWPPSCHLPRTLSFGNGDTVFKTVNLAYLDGVTSVTDAVDKPESWFTNSSQSGSFSTASDESGGDESIETVIRGLRSDRLFFEPEETNSIFLEEAKTGEFPFKESLALSMDSLDPFVDFKKSMAEMVEAYGLTDWVSLEELLSYYLQVNAKSNHGYIIDAFVDLLVGLAFASSLDQSHSCSSHFPSRSPSSSLTFFTTTTTTTTSDDSSSTPRCASSLEADEGIDHTPCLTSLVAENGTKKMSK